MFITSPEFYKIELSNLVPAHLDSFKINNSSPLSGATAKGCYLFQNFNCNCFQASFADLFCFDNHEIVFSKPLPSFIIVVQLINTLNLKVYNLPRHEHLEWSINLFYTNNMNAEFNLMKDQHYSTFYFFIPLELVQRLSRGYPIIHRFYKSQKNNHISDKLLSNNAICSFEVMDLVNSFKMGEARTLKGYIEFIYACFDLLCKKNVLKQLQGENETTRKIYALKKFMLEQPSQKLKRDFLCAKFDLSKYHFATAFSNIYGAPPFTFMRFYEMSEVKRELQNSNIGLKELAAKHGYYYTSLLRAYRSVYNEHPKDRRHKK